VLRLLSDRIAFKDQALTVNLGRLEDAWDEYQSSRERDGIYQHLSAVFELVSRWRHYDIAEMYARRAMCLKAGRPVDHVPEPFAAVIFCTADPAKVDYRMRSKWSRAMQYAAKFKSPRLTLGEFLKRGVALMNAPPDSGVASGDMRPRRNAGVGNESCKYAVVVMAAGSQRDRHHNAF
jgi:hypothetical protein